jgi:hypothetical protein
MPESCAPNPVVARKSLTTILHRLAAQGQKPIGEAIGKSETWVSRWKSEDAETCALLLSAPGLKVVPTGSVCYPREYVERLQYFARLGIQNEPPALDWDGDQ